MLPPPPAGRSFDVVGIGATSVDFVYLVPGAFAPKQQIKRHFVSCGGQVATALPTCARMGLRAKLAGVIGADDNAVRVSRELSERGVDVSEALVREAPNQYAVILVDEHSGERTVFWDRDERLALRDGELRPELVAG